MPKSDLVLLHAPSVYDFREESILYGPVSDLVPSTPVFEFYPIGFTTIAEYLERHGFRVRIVNLAVRMLNEQGFDPEKLIRSLDPLAFGIDLHWLSHAHGALKVAEIVKRHHPSTPVILGGFSASYFHEELMGYPQVDYVVRGDSTEEPVHELMCCIREGREPIDVPNLTWRDAQGGVHVNPLTYVPQNLDHVLIDYSYVVKAVARYRDLASYVPFKHWLSYPIMAGLTCRGCIHGCRTCGGSAQAFRTFYGRARPAYRDPETLAQDIRTIGRFSNGPVIILGDIRQPGMDYTERFLAAIKGLRRQVILELFDAASRDFMKKIAEAMPNFVLEISPESHSEEVRHAFGRPYGNAALEATMEYALEVGCQRLDIFFMIGLPKQNYRSVMETIDYCEYLLRRFDSGPDKRLFPFISPLAPFLDPGSAVFEDPEAYGYRLFHRTLEEHRQALLQPSWKYVLNYETQWMSRDEIVASTYEAGLRLNRLKARYGLIDPAQAEITERRILKAVRLTKQVDDIMNIADERRRRKILTALKPHLDSANLSTVCEKRELELPLGWLKLNVPKAALFLLNEMLAKVNAVGKGSASSPS
ncbi:MAG: TIGR04190 family B12-binding domain/radical SAM domain protein [Anaerolineae bacterium]